MTLLPDSGEPRNLLAGTVLGTDTKPALLTDATWQHLSERYQLRGELGQGGQAVVFLVKERAAPHRRLAVKVYHENTDDARKLFDHECRVLASDHLPQDLIVGYVQCVSEPGLQPYLVLEHIDGQPIGEYIQSARSMSVGEKIELWERLCRALHRLHQCHLVFGDLKSENVLVEKNGVIRFIDLAGSKLLKKAYSGSQSSQNLATPGVMPDAWKTGETRTALWTDIYVASAIGFLMLTGREKNDVLPAQWEAELIAHGIPSGVRRVVLKGLREKDPNKTDDPKLYPTAEHPANDLVAWRTSQLRRRALLMQSVITLALMLLVGVIGLVGWQKYWSAAAAADLKVWQSLQAEVRELPNLSHPAVAKLLEDEKQLIVRRDEAVARHDQLGARRVLGELLTKSRDVLRVAREVDRAARLREAIGKVLLEDEASERTGFWVTAAPMIGQRLDEMRRRYVALAGQIQAGQTESIPENLARLQTDLGELFRVNIEARSALDARVGYLRAKRQVPERLLVHDGFRTIDSGADVAQQSWAVIEWDRGKSLSLTRSQFGIAQQQLTEWLPKQLTPEELATLERGNQERVAELEVQRLKLLADIERQTGEVRTLNEQFTKLTQERLDDQQKLATATTTLASEQKLRRDAEAKAVKLDETQKKLAEVTATLEPSVKRLDEAKQKLIETGSKLAVAEQERDRHQQEAVRWKKLVQDNPGVRIAINEQLVAIEKDIGQLDPKNREAAHAALGKATVEYRRLEAERAELVKPNAFEPKHPKVKAKDAELADAGMLVESALKKRDDADKLAFAKLQQQIDARQKLHDDERALGVAEQNAQLVQLRSQIAALKQTQALHADGTQRADGRGKQPTLAELLALAGSAGSFGTLMPGSKAGDRSVIRVKGVAVSFRWCPAGTFPMSSPANEVGRTSDENQVTVTLTKGFWMLETEVTQELWTAIMGERNDWTVGKGPKYPAYNVSHDDAVEFCRKLNDQLKADASGKGTTVRLPTEAEWEYACRAGTKTAYSFGNDAAKLGDYAWHNGNSNNGAHPVGQKLPNDWGLCDMHGNLWEWCSDWYDSKLIGGPDPKGPSTGSYRCYRSGGWGYSGTGLFRSAYRIRSTPSYRYDSLGFRIVAVPQ